jgi:two-component system, OmpR family, manganese sensing sensor histidine kinase
MPMFEQIRYRLLLSYLMVLASILGIFAIAVRVTFTRSMNHQMTSELKALGQRAATDSELDQGQFRIGDAFSARELMVQGQALQWFDTEKHLVRQEGRAVLSLPLSMQKPLQIQSGTPRIQGITFPIIRSKDQPILGYVRASQSLAELDQYCQKLDWGLGIGIGMALFFSGIGGVWLTRQAMQPIEKNFQQLKQFTADASHELRSPLMAIKSNVAVALKYPEGMRSADGEKFEAIASATNQMTLLTQDLLMLSRSDTTPRQSKQTVNLTSILENLVQLHRNQAMEKQITFNAQLAKPLYTLGDVAQLTRLFSNLTSNALFYTPEGGTIELQSGQEDQMLFVAVRDTGIGIAPEHLARIFDRFWRADQSRAYWSGGSGLGLAIAQAIAQNHDGSITVTSQLAKGSCFTVRLPISQ